MNQSLINTLLLIMYTIFIVLFRIGLVCIIFIILRKIRKYMIKKIMINKGYIKYNTIEQYESDDDDQHLQYHHNVQIITIWWEKDDIMIYEPVGLIKAISAK